MIKAIYPGSFDPITVGHLDIIKRAANQFDTLYVVIMKNPSKKYTFSEDERKRLIEKCTKNIKNVKVLIGEGLTIDFAKKIGCTVIVRGIRAVSDYEAELALATSNMMLNNKIDTLFFVSRPELSFLSSSIAKEIASNGGNIDSFIPKPIQNEVKKKLMM